MSEDLKARLLSRRLPEGDVPIDGIGTVHVRGLSRGEVFFVQKIDDKAANEVAILKWALLDPVMNEADLKEWQRNSPAGEIEPVMAKIQELSGLAEDADKSGVPGVREDAGSGVRVLPGDEAVDDGGPAAGADEQ